MAVDDSHIERIYTALDTLAKEQVEQGKVLAGMAQHSKDVDIRLFGGNGQPGIIQYLANGGKANADEIATVKADVVTVKNSQSMKKAYVAGVAAGGGFVGALAIKVISFVKTGHF